MILFETTIRDADDVPVAGALAYIYDDNGALVSLTNSLGVAIANPLVADSLGYVSGYVPVPAFYTVKYYWAGRIRLIEDKVPLGASAESLAAYSQAFAPFYTTIAAGVAATVAGEVFSSAESGDFATYLHTGTAPYYELLVVPADETEMLSRDGHKIENLGALRGFFDKLDAFSQSEDAVLVVNSYGDSVSYDLAMTFMDQLAREHIGFIGTSSWSTPTFANNWETPSGLEPSGRWPGSGGATAVLAGGATAFTRPLDTTQDATYVPNLDQHWVVPNGGTVTFTIGLAGSNYRRCLAFLVKESGAGSATVELLNAATDAVITTTVVGSLANATITATHVDFTALDTSLGYKIRVTCTAGTIRVLGVVGMKRRCLVPMFYSWGGSYLQQQNRSSAAIFQYINDVLTPAITFVETRGETAAEFTGAGLGGDATSGITNLCTRLSTISGAKVLCGGRPTVSVTNDNAQTANYRAAARANDFVFIDGVAILKSNAALAAINWNKKAGVVDNVHLPLITAGFIAGELLKQVPLGHIRNLWSTRKTVSSEVVTSSVKVLTAGQAGEITNAIELLAPAATNVYNNGLVKNITSVQLRNPVSGALVNIAMSGGDMSVDQVLIIANGKYLQVGSSPLLFGRVSGWTKPTGTVSRAGYATYTAPTVSAGYVQAEVQAIAAGLQDVSRALGALINDLHQSSNTNARLLA